MDGNRRPRRRFGPRRRRGPGGSIRWFPRLPGKFIKAVTGVTLSATTGTAGNFGITATRQRAAISMPLANKSEIFDWAQLGLPAIADDACLMMLMMCSTTTTGTVRGQGKLIHG